VKGSAGVAACDATLKRLLQKVARQVFAKGDLVPTGMVLQVSVPASASSLAEYLGLATFSDRESYHSRMQSFVNAGAVTLEWDRNAGIGGQLSRVMLSDPAVVAELLGVDLPWVVARESISSLEATAKEGLPPISHILDGWRHGKAPGGVSASNVAQFVDSLRVIEAANRLGASELDLLLRRVSAQLFGDSKRIEALAKPLAYLLGEADGDAEEDVFARLGLVKYPQPMLISGSKSCCVRMGDDLLPLARPYLGLRPDTIDAMEVGNAPIRRVLTIENLASFNEAAQDIYNPVDLLLIYVAGQPTPSLLAAYRRILKTVAPASVMHWGDIDVGGFQIAARLADAAGEVGCRLSLWRMNPQEAASSKIGQAEQSKVDRTMAICGQYGWTNELNGLQSHPFFQEQEFLEWVPPLE